MMIAVTGKYSMTVLYHSLPGITGFMAKTGRSSCRETKDRVEVEPAVDDGDSATLIFPAEASPDTSVSLPPSGRATGSPELPATDADDPRCKGWLASEAKSPAEELAISRPSRLPVTTGTMASWEMFIAAGNSVEVWAAETRPRHNKSIPSNTNRRLLPSLNNTTNSRKTTSNPALNPFARPCFSARDLGTINYLFNSRHMIIKIYL